MHSHELAWHIFVLIECTQVNCPKAGIAFFHKADARDKKLIEYDVCSLPVSLQPLCSSAFGGLARRNQSDRICLFQEALHDLLHEAGDVPEKVVEDYLSWIEEYVREAPIKQG